MTSDRLMHRRSFFMPLRKALPILMITVAAAHAGEDHALSPWAIPAPGSCKPAAGEDGHQSIAANARIYSPERPPQLGHIIEYADVRSLEDFLPDAVFAHSDRFFHEGMKLEIGPCYRDYSPPAFFQAATRRNRGKERLRADGVIEERLPGLPFDPESIDPSDPQAGLKWAWNRVFRYTGAGRFGELRVSWVSLDRVEARFSGEFFGVNGNFPVEDGVEHPVKLRRGAQWASGGSTRNQANGDQCSWRQYGAYGRSSDIFAYWPGLHRVKRMHAPEMDGQIQFCLSGPYRNMIVHGGAPQYYDWRVLGVRDVIAPINVRTPAFPVSTERNFGPWGISYGSDRWELRRVIVLEGKLREGQFEDHVNRFEWWLDLQTLTPLYYVTDRDDGRPGGAAIYAHRWSGDRPDYPRWPESPERPVRVLDLAGVALADWSGKNAVRIENFETVSMPPSWKKLRRMLSQSSLSRGH